MEIKRLPDAEGWWARNQYGRIEWFLVKLIQYDKENEVELSILSEEMWGYDPVEKYTTPLTRWYGPICFPEHPEWNVKFS
jgi:hypothetical protein